MTTQTDRKDLELIRALAGTQSDAEQRLGQILAKTLADELPDVDSATRARVALHIGSFIGQVSGRSGDGCGVIWGNTVLTAAVNQEEGVRVSRGLRQRIINAARALSAKEA